MEEFEEFLRELSEVIQQQKKKAPSQMRAVEEFIWRVVGKMLAKSIPLTYENFKRTCIDYLSVLPSSLVDFKFEVSRVIDLAWTRYMNSVLAAAE